MHVQFVAVNGLHSHFLLCVPMFAPSSPPSADPRHTTYCPDHKTIHTASPHTDPLMRPLASGTSSESTEYLWYADNPSRRQSPLAQPSTDHQLTGSHFSELLNA